MDRLKIHMFIVFTMIVLITGFFVLLSPPFAGLRTFLGLPEHQPGSRYNETIGAVEIIYPVEDLASFYLARATFVYHAVFIILLYATLIGLSELYLEATIKKMVLDLSLIGALMTAIGAVTYNYVDRNFLWHGVFIMGLAIFFVIGIIILFNFRPKNLLDWNIWFAGVLILIGSIIGGWLGASFMTYRDEFVNELINGRFNPDIPAESIFWRALTAHEHAMVALALVLSFLLAIKIIGVKETQFTKIMFYLVLLGQILMASACYAVWGVGGIAHLVITPASLTLIFGTLMLSLKTEEKGLLKWGLILGNIIMWVAVAIPGALVATSLRKPMFFNPAFRDPAWDWAELAYNIGHWHILLASWGVVLLIIYIYWPENLTKSNKIVYWSGWLTLIGYAGAMCAINLYMLGNPPGEYIPNAYNNIWVSYLVEPSLTAMSIGIGMIYLFFLWTFVTKDLKIFQKFLVTRQSNPEPSKYL